MEANEKSTSTSNRTWSSKAAAVIVALGSNNASSVYKYLRNEEVEKLSVEVSKLDKLPQDELNEIVGEFYGLCMTERLVSEGGYIYAKEILEKAFGAQLATTYMDRVSKNMHTMAMGFMRKANFKTILMMVKNEHPQTIAFVLSYAKASQASQVIAELPKELQLDVVKRIATLESVLPEVVDTTERVLESKFASVSTEAMTEIGGVNYVADVMNKADRATEKYIFGELSKIDPVLSDEIRKLMFVFEDIVNLDEISIQRILRDVDQQDLAIAIKGSSDEVKEMLLANVSSRSRQTIMEDMQYLKNLRMRDVEEAQQKIVASIRELEESGEIVLSKGGDDDAIIS